MRLPDAPGTVQGTSFPAAQSCWSWNKCLGTRSCCQWHGQVTCYMGSSHCDFRIRHGYPYEWVEQFKPKMGLHRERERSQRNMRIQQGRMMENDSPWDFFGGFPLEFSRQSHVLHQFRRHPMGASPWGGTSFKPRKPRNEPSDGGGDVSSDDRTFQHTLPDLTWRYLRFRYITLHYIHYMTWHTYRIFYNDSI